MRIIFLTILAIHTFINACGQGNDNFLGDTIIKREGNREFIEYAEKFCRDMAKGKKDSLLMFYDFNGGNSAVVIYKGKKARKSFFIHQFLIYDTIIAEELENPVFAKVDINRFYSTLSKTDIKSIDTTKVNSGNGLVYCKFYLGKKERFFSGWYDSFRMSIYGISKDFIGEFNKVRLRITNKY